MHVIVTETSKFRAAVARVAATVTKSDANPIQSAIKLWTQDGRLLITTVDTTSHQLTLGVDANVQVHGAVLLEADYFSKVLSRVGDHPLQLNQDDRQPLYITCGEDVRDFVLFGALVEDFPVETAMPPVVAKVDGEALHEFQKSLLQGTINKDQDLGFSTVEGETRLRGYAGDSGVGLLVRCELGLTDKADEFACKIPYGVWRRMPVFTGELTLHSGDGLFVVASGDEHFLVRVADTDVDMDSLDFIFDKDPSGYVTTEAKPFREKVSSLKINKVTQVIRLSVLDQEKKLMLSAADAAYGGGRLKVGLDDISGQTPRLMFDANCLDKAVQSIGTQNVLFSYLLHDSLDETEIWVMKAYDEANPRGRQAVILPIQE